MDRTAASRKRARQILGVETMEGRALMTGGVGNTFALMAGSIATAGQATDVSFVVKPGEFTRPGGRVVLGVDVTAQTNSTADPKIASVTPAGQAAAATGRRHAATRAVPTTRTGLSSAVLVTLGAGRKSAAAAENYTVKVSGQNNTTGAIVVGFYLPGDADGNGKVEQADYTAVKKLMGKTVASDDYSFDADANRDGVINNADLKYTRINRGAATVVSPVLTANLDPASDTGDSDRITTASTVRFSGVATPGATVTYKEVAGRTPDFTATSDASGNYSMNIDLAVGVNTYRVTSSDGFGQVISGQITPVIRQTPDSAAS